MLSHADNQLLSRVGPGTPMGTLLRQYWQPVLLSAELAEPDGPPVRVRLLGEDLIAFRDSGGRPGVVANACPHRGASLFFGRNEEDGLRCVYHGWKFDVTGACIDMPNEPAESNFKHKIRVGAYRCEERGDVIWAYMGPEAEAPAPPALEFVSVPANHRFMVKRYQDCNWAQSLEGDIDSSHVGFLHSELRNGVRTMAPRYGAKRDYITEDSHPRFETLETDYGLAIAARRTTNEGDYYWRVTAFVLPFYTIIPTSGDGPIGLNAWVPMDDETTMVWSINWHAARPLTPEELQGLRSGAVRVGTADFLPPASEPGGAWKTKADMRNDYLLDRAAQRTTSFSGLQGFWNQDRAIVESMGTLLNRTREHLGWADSGVIHARRLLLRSAKALAADGRKPAGLDPATQQVRAVAAVLPATTPWVTKVKELSVARLGEWVASP